MSTTKNDRPVPTFDHLAKKKPREVRDFIVLDEDVADRFDAAKRELASARLVGEAERLTKAEAAYAAVEPEMRDNAVEVVFRSIGQKQWKKLKQMYAPTPAQIEEVRKVHKGAVLEFNSDTFPPAAISRCCVQPVMTEDQVKELAESEAWSTIDYARLLELAMQANTQRRRVDFTF